MSCAKPTARIAEQPGNKNPQSVWKPKLCGVGFELRRPMAPPSDGSVEHGGALKGSSGQVSPASGGVVKSPLRSETASVEETASSPHGAQRDVISGPGKAGRCHPSASDPGIGPVAKTLLKPELRKGNTYSGSEARVRSEENVGVSRTSANKLDFRNTMSRAMSVAKSMKKMMTNAASSSDWRGSAEWRSAITVLARRAEAQVEEEEMLQSLGTRLEIGGNGLECTLETAGGELCMPRKRSMRSFGMQSHAMLRHMPFLHFKRVLGQFLCDPMSSRSAWIYSRTSMFLIVATVVAALADVLFDSAAFSQKLVLCLEVPFAAEIALRLCVSRSCYSLLDVYNIVDALTLLASTLPRFLGLLIPMDPDASYAIRVCSPFLVLLRLLRRFDHFQLLTSAFVAAAQAMPVLMYTLFLIVLFFASAIFLVEPREAVPTMQDSLWFTVVTMFTVGYGDISPKTIIGRFLSSTLIILSCMYTVMPIGIVGNAFSKVWEDRKRVLAMQHLRRRIIQAGYEPRELRMMFQGMDEDNDGQLTFAEFKDFLPRLKIDVSSSVAFQVFETFDEDGCGTIDFAEFLLGVFPTSRYLQNLNLASPTSLLTGPASLLPSRTSFLLGAKGEQTPESVARSQSCL